MSKVYKNIDELIDNELKFSDNFCFIPFLHLSLCRGFFCIHGQCREGLGPFWIGNEEGKSYETSNSTISEAWNSSDANLVREVFAKNERSNNCRSCWEEDDASVTSKRKNYIHIYLADYVTKNNIDYNRNDFDINKLYTKIKRDLIENRRSFPEHIDVKMSNLCNLKCRVCSFINSSSWKKEDEEIDGIDKNVLMKTDYCSDKEKTLSKADNFISDFVTNSSKIHKIDFFGGEPFLAPETKVILDTLVSSGHSKNIEVTFISNGTILKPEITKVFSSFKSIDMSISMDGIGQHAEYIRHPLNWNQWLIHLKKYDLLSRMVPLRISLSATISIFNIYYYPELINYFIDFFEKRSEKFEDHFNFHASVVYSPVEYSIINMPKHAKHEVMKKYNLILESNEKKLENFIPHLRGILNLMNSEPNEILSQDDILNKITKHDQYRKESFFEVFPEWAKILFHKDSNKLN